MVKNNNRCSFCILPKSFTKTKNQFKVIFTEFIELSHYVVKDATLNSVKYFLMHFYLLYNAMYKSKQQLSVKRVILV